jgi:hypothetical protein
MFSAFRLFAFIGLFAFGGAGMVQAATPAKRTNFLVVLVRDLGFSDAGCYGGEMETPYMDYLASKGLRFTQAYHAAGKGFTEPRHPCSRGTIPSTCMANPVSPPRGQSKRAQNQVQDREMRRSRFGRRCCRYP